MIRIDEQRLFLYLRDVGYKTLARSKIYENQTAVEQAANDVFAQIVGRYKENENDKTEDV